MDEEGIFCFKQDTFLRNTGYKNPTRHTVRQNRHFSPTLLTSMFSKHSLNMKFAFIQVAAALLLTATALTAQPNKKVGPALSKFLNTEFMTKFRDLRIQAESQAISAQSRKDELKPADFMRLRSAYDQTASRANSLIENIKQDFLNAKKLKSIAQFPEMYSDGLRYKLQDLSDFYTANFQQVLADAEVKDVDGSAILLLVVELISLSKGLTDYFAAIKREARQYTEAHLQENLVQPYRWRYWDEMSGGTSQYEKFEKSAEMNTVAPGEDLLDKQIQRISDKATTIDFKALKGEDSGSGFEVPTENTSAQGTDFQYENWTPDSTKTDTVKTRDIKPTTPSKKPVKPAKPIKTVPTAPAQKPSGTEGKQEN